MGESPVSPRLRPGPANGSGPAARRTRWLIGLLAGVVALALVVGGTMVFVRIQKSREANTAPDKAITSRSALKGFLEALALGDADKAKQYAMNRPADSPTLGNDFLAAMVAKNPITDIVVDPMNDYGTTSYLSASYRMGATLVQGNYTMTKVADVWKVNDIVATDQRPVSWGKLAVTIDGTAVTGPTVSLFPGVYELSSGTSLIDLSATTFTVKEPSTFIPGLASVTPVLSAKGKAAMIGASQAWLAQCLTVQDTSPKGCGMDTPLPNGATLAPGTMTRTVSSAGTPFADASPQIAYDDPLSVSMTDHITIKLAAKDTAGKSYDGRASITSSTGTITGETITVVFDR